MIKGIVSLMIALFITGCKKRYSTKERVLISNLDKRKDGRVFYKKKPYTGIGYELSENRKVLKEYKYKNGLLNGRSVNYYSDGTVAWEGEYNMGYSNGDIVSYYKNGTVKEKYTTKKGLRNGKSVKYYESGGILSESEYKDGFRSGDLIKYDENGKIAMEKDVDGNYKRYYKSGEIMEESTKNTYESEYTKYSINGEVVESRNYKEGEVEGSIVEVESGREVEGVDFNILEEKEGKVYLKGKLYTGIAYLMEVLYMMPVEKMTYKNGVLDGKCLEYYVGGAKKNEREYKDGCCITKE